MKSNCIDSNYMNSKSVNSNVTSSSVADQSTAAESTLRISCESVEIVLTQTDSELPVAVVRHLESCRHCRREHEDALALRQLVSGDLSSLAALAIEDCGEDPLFVRSVMSRVSQEPAPVRRLRRGWRARTVAALLVAAVLPAALVWALLTGGAGLGGDLASQGGESQPATVASLEAPVVDDFEFQDQFQSSLGPDDEFAAQESGWLYVQSEDSAGNREVLSF